MRIKSAVYLELNAPITGHIVELTERDLLLLEGLLAEYMPVPSEHIVHMLGTIQLMLTDY